MRRAVIRAVLLTQKNDARCFGGRSQRRGNKRAKTRSNKAVRQFLYIENRSIDEWPI